MDVEQAAQEFLAAGRIAVTGVSREPAGHGGNVVYTRLRELGRAVVPVNPNAERVEGDECWPDLASVPGGVDAVLIATAPEDAVDTVRECIDLGIDHVWMHRSMGAGSVSPEAVRLGREHGLRVIDGGCPLMFGECSDFGHRLMRHVCTWTGAVPRAVA